MRVIWLTGLGACFAMAGCTPPPSDYYGASPGYVPQPYAAVPGGPVQQPLTLPDASGAPGDPGPGYADLPYTQPGYPEPATLARPPGYYAAPGYGYAPGPVLPPAGFYSRRDRFDLDRYNRDHFERERLERERGERERAERGRFEQNRSREQFERERFEQGRLRERVQMERQHPPPPQPGPPPAFQGQARPPDLRREPDARDRRGLSPEQLRHLR